MWTCEGCGTQAIAGDLTVCPGCGAARGDVRSGASNEVQGRGEDGPELTGPPDGDVATPGAATMTLVGEQGPELWDSTRSVAENLAMRPADYEQPSGDAPAESQEASDG